MIIVLVSGGLDSTGMLVKLLTETDEELYVHHCVIKNADFHEQQLKAVTTVIEYCKKHYRHFEFSMSEIESDLIYRNLSTTLLWTTVGCTLAKYKNASSLAIGYLDIFLRPYPNRQKVSTVIHNNIRDTIIKKSHPIEIHKKYQVLAYIPEELRSHVWSCERPTNSGEVCYICPSCIQKTLAEENLEKLNLTNKK